ncbi:hypothetical protein HJC23_011754 [Cyclotella cryptica]|uniref:S-adenosylmethionine-dependent methyltransferase domain-containing protein n=1 Tax=Cyclotella cryptica TaxID=29204 RepID=A0ABD3PG14_9STRA|eukprot:CCRYP_014800-RB/>CCRYP_014800-RB protein AED:0.04 eAED:0.04 QI:240/1/1/1/0.33/0.25/4/2524/616
MRAAFSTTSFLLLVIMTTMLQSFVSTKTLRIGFGYRPSTAYRVLHAKKMQVIPAFTAVRPIFSRREMNTCKICTFSTSSADINLESTATKLSKEGNQNPATTKNNALHTVMVHRNKQSLAFREGTPLVFTNSIAATYTENFGSTSVEGSDDDIPFGALVSVVVSRDASGGDSNAPKNKNRSKRTNASHAAKGNSTHQHFTFNGESGAKYRDEINKSQLIGYGVYNPHSMYRVRMLLHETLHPGLTKDILSVRKRIQRGDGDGSAFDADSSALLSILERKINDAMYLRLAMNLPSPGITDTYRLINGEGDGLSGLAVDIIGGTTAIVMSSAAWCEIHKDQIIFALEKSLRGHPSYRGVSLEIVWRNTPSRLVQDGYEVEDTGLKNNDEVSVVATESSVKYVTYPFSDGQKTGFYCDQRENRMMIANYCENKRVLDLCCYSGGFSLNAMMSGKAASALGVDSSQDAVDAAMANAQLNGLDRKNIAFVRDDIASFMKNAIERNDEYDVVILDPPKLAPSISSLTKASRKYHSLNRDAMNLINKSSGGLLLTCTCSAAMTQQNGGQYFLSMVNTAALSAKRQATLLQVNGAAPCHTQSPASFPAGNYLTCSLFFVGPADT